MRSESEPASKVKVKDAEESSKSTALAAGDRDEARRSKGGTAGSRRKRSHSGSRKAGATNGRKKKARGKSHSRGESTSPDRTSKTEEVASPAPKNKNKNKKKKAKVADPPRGKKKKRSKVSRKAPATKKTSKSGESGTARSPQVRGAADTGVVQKRILIDYVDPEELRIAVLEDGRLEEISVEVQENKAYVGNIYKGRIVNLEPAIQAAFVDIGIGRNGFLHVSDVLPVYAGAKKIPVDSLSKRPADRKRLKIQDLLENGQEILVQISKDSIGAKGPSLTTYISIPGKYLVLMPGVLRYGVSKRIQDREVRTQLRESLSKLNPPKGLGYIIRTASKGNVEEDLLRDFNNLMEVWKDIRKGVESEASPKLLSEEAELLARALRDICGPDVNEVVVNDENAYQRVREVLQEIMPNSDVVPQLYTGHLPLFSKFGIEDEIEKIYNRRIALPSGGYLIIEQTEALVAIDVNSGKYTDEDDLEDTALKTNLEAADEIARQLRLRDLGGVVVNDFIDMMNLDNRREVEKAFRAALKRDRAKCWVSKISRFGIVEMTRQRVRPSLERSVFEPCKFCRGTGRVKSVRTAGTAVLRDLRVGLATRRKKNVEIRAHPDVQSFLVNHKRRQLLVLEETFKKSVLILADPNQEPDQFSMRFF